MKVLLISLFFSLCIHSVQGQQKIKFHYDKSVDLSEKTAFAIGFEYENWLGKLKRKGAFFDATKNLSRFNIELHGGVYNRNTGMIQFNRKKLVKLGYRIIVKYSHPKNKNEVFLDTIQIPFPKCIESEQRFTTNGAEFKLNLMASYSDGKTKKITENEIDQFLDRHDIKLNITNGQYQYYGVVKVWSEQQYNRKYSQLLIEYSSSFPGFISSVDSINVLKITDVDIEKDQYYFDSIQPIRLNLEYSDGSLGIIDGKDVDNIFNSEDITFQISMGNLNFGNIIIGDFEEELPLELSIRVSNELFDKKFVFPVVLNTSYCFDFSGNSAQLSRGYSHGDHGQHGNHVRVVIQELPKYQNIYKAEILSGQIKESIYFDPRYGEVKIYANGGDGARGSNGKTGRAELEDQPALPGEHGGHGGNGGDGGDVTLSVPKSFLPYLGSIVIENNGGEPGRGGYGGNGGIIDSKDSDWVDLFFPDRVEPGADGANGRRGQNGKVEVIYY